MNPQPDRDSKRRSVAPLIDPANSKGEALTWEEEELATYEPKRAKALEESRLAVAKAELLLRQLPQQWKALREVITIRCESLNARAGRTILRSTVPDPDRLEIRREDESKMEVHFEPDKKRVTFSGKAFGYDREYELIVQSYGGVDSTIWFSQATLAPEHPDDIAKSMIATFLRAEEC
jgi:hypothetical protein